MKLLKESIRLINIPITWLFKDTGNVVIGFMKFSFVVALTAIMEIILNLYFFEGMIDTATSLETITISSLFLTSVILTYFVVRELKGFFMVGSIGALLWAAYHPFIHFNLLAISAIFVVSMVNISIILYFFEEHNKKNPLDWKTK